MAKEGLAGWMVAEDQQRSGWCLYPYSYEINLKVFLINKTIFKSNNLKLNSRKLHKRAAAAAASEVARWSERIAQEEEEIRAFELCPGLVLTRDWWR